MQVIIRQKVHVRFWGYLQAVEMHIFGGRESEGDTIVYSCKLSQYGRP